VTPARTMGQATLMTRKRPSASAKRNAGFAASARKARSSGAPVFCTVIGLAVDLGRRDEVELDRAFARRDERADMRAGIRLIGRAGDLQVVVARLFFRHSELADRGPVLDPGDRGARRELVVDRLILEMDSHLDLAAAVQVGLHAGALRLAGDEHVVADRLGLVLDEEDGVAAEPVLCAERRTQRTERFALRDLDVFEGGDALALIKDTDILQVGLPGQ
jgi:hypothetical protein